jgi:manganese-dependent inorganic pyrophosphatase
MTPTYIIGHRNPDADAICSAIAYAAYKEAKGEPGFVPARCGNSNARIDSILTRFHQPLPIYLSDVFPRVQDLMSAAVIAVPENATCADALELIDRHDLALLPVANAAGQIVGTVSLAHLGGVFIPRINEPRLMRQVDACLANIVRALKGKTHHLVDGERNERLFIRLGTMDAASFWKLSDREQIPAAQSIIIVGDRRDIQQRAVEHGVRGVVITGNLPVEHSLVAQAREKGVSVIASPWDSATTALIVRTASTIERVIDRDVATVHPDARIAEIRRKLAALPGQGYVVVDDDGALLGFLAKSDIIKPVQTQLVLVDHNEMSQAVAGAEEVTITEIIDHHRLGSFTTAQPILFINEPVGSTCTIVADLFRREGLTPTPAIAGIMMSGLITDTLHLNSPTSTPKDAELLRWLSAVAGVDSKELAESIFASGSIILAQSADKVVRTDYKIYEEDDVRYAVSQVEELGFANFWQKAKELSAALQNLRDEEKLLFTALLVTDINTQNSLMLVKGDPEVIRRISFSHVEKDEIFDLPGIVSRKKQVIPYFTSLLKEIAATA